MSLDDYRQTFASFLKRPKDAPHNFYNLTHSGNAISAWHPEHISRLRDDKAELHPLLNSRYKNVSPDLDWDNSQFRRQADTLQRLLGPRNLIIPCQWDDQNNLGQSPAVGCHFAYHHSPKTQTDRFDEPDFIMAFHRTGMTNYKLHKIKCFLNKDIIKPLFPDDTDDKQAAYRSELNHPYDKPPRFLFEHCLCMPLTTVMHDNFSYQMNQFKHYINDVTGPTHLFARMWRSVNHFVHSNP